VPEAPKPAAWTEPYGADLALRARAADLAGAFTAAALELGRLLAEGQRRAVERRSLRLEAADRDCLLVALLEELLYLFESEGLLPAELTITLLSAGRLEAELGLDHFDPERHELGRAVKAVTWHRLEIAEDESGASVHAVLDL
jgi:SHS2 domain-containing protein